MGKYRTLLLTRLSNTPKKAKIDGKLKKLASGLPAAPHNTSSYLIDLARKKSASNLIPSLDFEFMTLGGSMMDLMKKSN